MKLGMTYQPHFLNGVDKELRNYYIYIVLFTAVINNFVKEVSQNSLNYFSFTMPFKKLCPVSKGANDNKH